MNPHSAYRLQILEKIAAPLLAAADSHKGTDGAPSEAAIVAELLARSVQSGVELANVMDVRESGAEGESIRLALAALTGPLMAGHYRNTGKVPGESEVKRMIAALSAALTFADNFSPAAGNTARLAALEAGTAPADDTQATIQCLQALTPVVVAIAAYSFGRPEKKMVQDVTERLVRQARTMAAHLVPGASPSDTKLAELTLLRAMVPLYCEAHQAETRRLMAMDESSRHQAAQMEGGVLSLAALWDHFDRQLAMLDILGQTLLASYPPRPAQATSGGQDGPGRPQIPAEAAVVPPTPAPISPPPAASAPPAAPSGAYNPMAFFKPGQAKAGDEENT